MAEGDPMSKSVSHTPRALREAYDHCLNQARLHYENFPVVSLFLPQEQRLALAAIYAFARCADDIADEGTFKPEERHRDLNAWEAHIDLLGTRSDHHPVFLALADTIERFRIPLQLFRDLITAFRSDINRQPFKTFPQLLEYCRFSANPVGRMVLHVFRDTNPSHLMWSDQICTALQLTNFWQDLSLDLFKGRVYLPLEDLTRFRYTQEDLAGRIEDGRFQALLRFQVERTWELFSRGVPLIHSAPPALRRQLALTWAGGTHILSLIEASQFRVLTRRPSLGWRHAVPIIFEAFFYRRRWSAQQQP